MSVENRLDKCPFCRKVFVSSPGNWPSSEEASLAEQHWLYWFTRMNGYEIIQEVQLIRAHIKLRTGNFRVRMEAGRCVDYEAARIYVENQLHEYQVSGWRNFTHWGTEYENW